jgi:general secretion pathway protein G
MKRQNRRIEAFTLIEIMAVVIIIGLLSGIVGTAIFQRVDQGKTTAASAQISNLESVLELYRMDNGRFPTTDQGLEALVNQPSGDAAVRNYPPGGYLRGGRLPRDPWGEPYHYEAPGQHNQHSFDLWSTGSDGNLGGEGTDADIGNWAEERQS